MHCFFSCCCFFKFHPLNLQFWIKHSDYVRCFSIHPLHYETYQRYLLNVAALHVFAFSHIILYYFQLFKIFMKLIDGCLVGSMDSSMNLIPEGSDDWSWRMHMLTVSKKKQSGCFFFLVLSAFPICNIFGTCWMSVNSDHERQNAIDWKTGFWSLRIVKSKGLK